jgi:nicotinamidase-related amidase
VRGRLGSYTEQDVLDLAREAYERGRTSAPFDLRHAALLVIDMQAEFVEPGWTANWIPEATRMIPRLARVLAAVREVRLPVVHTAFGATHHYRDRPLSGAMMRRACTARPASRQSLRRAHTRS